MTTLNLQVSSSADDASEENGGTIDLTSTLVVLQDAGAANTKRYLGVRWTNVTIIPPVTVSSAVLSIYAHTTASDDPSLDIWAEDVDNAAAFAATNGNISGRTKTTATISWNEVGTGTGWQSPASAVTALVQEVLDRSGWTSGNAIAFILDQGTANVPYDVSIRTYDYAGNIYGAKLDITYTPATQTISGAGSIASAETHGQTDVYPAGVSAVVAAPEIPRLTAVLYDRDVANPTLLVGDAMSLAAGTLRFSTHVDGGFLDCSFSRICDHAEARRWIKEWPLARLVIVDGSKIIYEGRLEDIARRPDGVELGFMGYISACYDQEFADTDTYSGGAVTIDNAAIIKDVLLAACPLISADHSFIGDPNRVVTPIRFEGDEKAGDIIRRLADAGDGTGEFFRPWHFQVWENRTPYLIPRDRSTIHWRMSLEEMADFEFGWSVDTLLNRVRVEYEERAGSDNIYQTKVTEAWTSAASYAKYGIWRDGRTTIGRGPQNAAEGMAYWIIDEMGDGLYAGSFRVRNKIRDASGDWRPVWHVRAGDVVFVEDLDLDEGVLNTRDLFGRMFITATECEYDPHTGEATLTVTPPAGERNFIASVQANQGRWPNRYRPIEARPTWFE